MTRLDFGHVPEARLFRPPVLAEYSYLQAGGPRVGRAVENGSLM